MKKTALMIGITTALAISSSAAFAANANTTQKGSLLIFPKIDVRADTTTWIRIVNDNVGALNAGATLVKCYYMDVNKARVDLDFTLSAHQPIVFDAASGDVLPLQSGGSVNAYPEAGVGIGELICFAVTEGGEALRNFNQLHGTATVVKDGTVAEYNAWAFKAANGGIPSGDLDLNGIEYDSCPAYLFGQFSPVGSLAPDGGTYADTVVDISSCKQDLRQAYAYNYTKLLFEVWKYDERKLTGAYECSNSFFEDSLGGIQTGAQNFSNRLVRGPAYYRVTGMADGQWCKGSTATGLVGVQTSYLKLQDGLAAVTAELGAGNTAGPAGFVLWDPASTVTGKK